MLRPPFFALRCSRHIGKISCTKYSAVVPFVSMSASDMSAAAYSLA